MTVLTAFQRACTGGIALSKPTAVYGQTARELIELGELANAAAETIALSHEWEALQGLATLTGDGTTTAFDMPADFQRFLKDVKLYSSVHQAPLVLLRDRQTWLGMLTRGETLIVPAAIVYGGQMHFNPAPADGETIRFWYQSRDLVTAADASTQPLFLDDTDTFRLDETLLKLAMVWMWKAGKGLGYGEEMAEYGLRLSRLAGPEVSTESFTTGQGCFSDMGDPAYPVAFGDS